MTEIESNPLIMHFLPRYLVLKDSLLLAETDEEKAKKFDLFADEFEECAKWLNETAEMARDAAGGLRKRPSRRPIKRKKS